MDIKCFLVWLFTFGVYSFLMGQGETMIHAHNDYINERPLYGALEFGAHSIEIDIVYDAGLLKVSHDLTKLKAKPTIETLYFDPLIQLIKLNDIQKLWLLVDLKTTGKATLDLLHQIIQDRNDYFVSRDEPFVRKPFQVILSGNINREVIAQNSKYKYFFLDGRPSDLGKEYDQSVMPMISTRFDRRINKHGPYKIRRNSRRFISKLNKQVEKEGKVLRLWNTPDEIPVWKVLRRLGVDVIGTDDVLKLSTFIKSTR